MLTFLYFATLSCLKTPTSTPTSTPSSTPTSTPSSVSDKIQNWPRSWDNFFTCNSVITDVTNSFGILLLFSCGQTPTSAPTSTPTSTPTLVSKTTKNLNSLEPWIFCLYLCVHLHIDTNSVWVYCYFLFCPQTPTSTPISSPTSVRDSRLLILRASSFLSQQVVLCTTWLSLETFCEQLANIHALWDSINVDKAIHIGRPIITGTKLVLLDLLEQKQNSCQSMSTLLSRTLKLFALCTQQPSLSPSVSFWPTSYPTKSPTSVSASICYLWTVPIFLHGYAELILLTNLVLCVFSRRLHQLPQARRLPRQLQPQQLWVTRCRVLTFESNAGYSF